MSIYSEISRIEGIAASIHNKVTSLGIAVASPSKLADDRDAINSIASQSVGVSKLTADTTAVTISKGYYNANATIAVDVCNAPTVVLSSVASTIQCDDKMMNGNITIPAVNFYSTGSQEPSGGNDGDIYLIV